jgi:ATP-binding cassette, subfamily C (CFTR/MRP), member 1
MIHIIHSKLSYAIFTAVTILFVDIGARIGGILAAVPIHAGAVRAMLHAPTSFYDVTPAGRIVARFSNDMYTVDVKLPELLADIIWIVCKVSLSAVSIFQS